MSIKLPGIATSSWHDCLCVTVFLLTWSLTLSHGSPSPARCCHHLKVTSWPLTPCSLSTEQPQLSLFLSLSASLNCAAPKSSSLISPFYHLRRPPKLTLSSPSRRLSGHWALQLKAASGCHPLGHTEEKAISPFTRIVSSWTPFLTPYSSNIVLQFPMFFCLYSVHCTAYY